MPLSEKPSVINALDRASLRFLIGIAWESMPEGTFDAFGHLAKELYRQMSEDVLFGGDDITTLYYRDPARVAKASVADCKRPDPAPEFVA